MNKLLRPILFLVLMAFMFSVAPVAWSEPVSLKELRGQTYYLACNLHADPTNNRLYSVNYQIPGGLIPWGTKVKMLKVSKKKIEFEDVTSNIRYTYFMHKRTLKATTPLKHLTRIFIDDIDGLKQKVKKLSHIDKQGIEEGRVLEGMSKEGVLIAIGPPPEFATPNPMKSSRWHYWYNRWGQFYVQFNNKGVVEQIIGHY